ncbi:MAG: hypothetical protein K2G00_04610 [Duncaniella sp.]|nr:hypothetical protein [Duncaniella sp.]
MKIATLDNARFREACRMLAREVVDSGFRPDIIVGIRTGGEYVAREMLPAFPEARLALGRLQRPSTSHKSLLRPLLRRLPRRLLDIMRMAEARLLALRPSRPLPKVDLGDDIRALLPAKVLVVDDAVDSGVTLAAIAGALRAESGERMAESGGWREEGQVRSAVITVTTSRPAINPDYALYRHHTLIRFPWSMDMN